MIIYGACVYKLQLKSVYKSNLNAGAPVYKLMLALVDKPVCSYLVYPSRPHTTVQFRSDRSHPVQFSAAHLVARSGTVGTDVRGMRYWADHPGMVVPIGSVLYSSVVEFPKRE